MTPRGDEIRVLLVDDHAMVREGLRRVLAEGFPAASIAEASSAADAMAAVERSAWDIVILDLSLPGRSGLEALKEMRARRGAMPVLVVTMYAEEQYAVRAFRAGASGFLTKDSPPDALIDAVRKVVNGGKYVTPALAETLASGLGTAHRVALHQELSDRELQVLRMLGAGLAVKEIAAELALSAKTVSTYRTRILEKMQLRTTAQLVRYALVAGLVD